MTKNNLTAHLKWLLQQGSSLYPSLSPSAHEFHSTADQTHPTAPVPASGVLASQPEGIRIDDLQPSIRSAATSNVKEKEEADSDTEMARLLLTPGSGRKPRMLSLAKDSVPPTPKPFKSSQSAKSPARKREDVSGTRTKGTVKV